MFLLFDCNNFFASCEQVFRPDWRRRPLVVLSNNDGCVISRSPEAKAIGIAMGEPYFKCRARLEAANAVVCSSNFSLYTDLSDRIMMLLEEALPGVQQYSIDEAFSHVDDVHDWVSVCRNLRATISRGTGITVSVGIAPTRTLCKLANETAKHCPAYDGLLVLSSPEDWTPLLEETPVDDVWGVGRRLAPRMHALGIRTAAGLAACGLQYLRKHFGVHGERLSLELNGVSCLDESPSQTRQQIMVSRSLREGITELLPLREALCRFVEKAGRILRAESLMCSSVHVVLRTSYFRDDGARYAANRGTALSCPTDDTRLLTHAAASLLEGLYRPGYEYRKVGVLLTGLQKISEVQPTFEHPRVAPSKLMAVLDKLQKAGHNIHFANQGKQELWHRSFASPAYTTRWADIPETSPYL
ncbi:MAG: Y-family DNA polymerase [Akkermansia sp.]|nr:Y-family DNA polymerase [Akkermansia sp.]